MSGIAPQTQASVAQQAGSPFQMPPRRPRLALVEGDRDATARGVWMMGFSVFLAGLVASLGAILLAR